MAVDVKGRTTDTALHRHYSSIMYASSTYGITSLLASTNAVHERLDVTFRDCVVKRHPDAFSETSKVKGTDTPMQTYAHVTAISYSVPLLQQ